jgi:hypothetical protein
MAELLSIEHLATLGVITTCIAALVIAARLRPGAWIIPACRALAVLIVVNECGWWVWLAFQHTWSASYALPLQLCDVVAFVSAAALWTRRPLLVELTYFWGLAGTANGLISPDVPTHFPSYLFLQYFHRARHHSGGGAPAGRRPSDHAAPRRCSARFRAGCRAGSPRRGGEPDRRQQLPVPTPHARRAQPPGPVWPVAVVYRRCGWPGPGDFHGPGSPVLVRSPPARAKDSSRQQGRLIGSATVSGHAPDARGGDRLRHPRG